ncbi:hypothetical protein ACTFIZ_012913 [Dictyostelium cf. discoideum]
MSTTVNNNEASSSSTSVSNNAESLDLRMKSMEDQINNLSLAFTRFMKEPMFSSNTASHSNENYTLKATLNTTQIKIGFKLALKVIFKNVI